MISIIFPAYNEQENLMALHQRMEQVAQVLKKRGMDVEIIFVDDCSSDGTKEILAKLHEKDPRVKVIRFARNAGSHMAVRAGLARCSGDCAIILASDLQDPPELALDLIDQWQKGNKIVWGLRSAREGESRWTQFCSRAYYFLMNKMASVKTPPNGADVFLADRVVINVFSEITERNTSIFMTLASMGYRQGQVEYVKKIRHAGKSKWTLTKKFKLFFDSLVSFSDQPIKWITYAGGVVFLLGILSLVCLAGQFLSGVLISEVQILIVIVLCVGGIQLLALGILGEYLWRTYDESRKRPLFVIERMLGFEKKDGESCE